MKSNIDGDIVLYESGFSSETSYYRVCDEECFPSKRDAIEWANYFEIPHEYIEKIIKPLPLQQALKKVNTLINNIVNGAGCDSYTVFLTGKDNFRIKDALPLPKPFNVYKGNRDTSHRPHWYKEIKTYLLTSWRAVVVDDMEADDVLGYEQGSDTVLCSIDKDLKMIQGWHYDWRKDVKLFVSQKDAEDFFYVQLLTGDRTDNIPGLFALTGRKATAKIKKELLSIPSHEGKLKYIADQYGEENAQYVGIIRRLITIAKGPSTYMASAPDIHSGSDVATD